MRIDADVIIVGGSVAGAATAAFLANSGRSVIVLDRARFPRDKPCGEGLMPHGVDVLAELGVLDRVRAAGAVELRGVRYTLSSGETVRACFPSFPGRADHALGIRRLALDRLLLERAREGGNVSVREGFRVTGLLRCGDVVAGVTDGTEEMLGRVVVGADGLRSAIRKLLGWEASRGWPRRYAAVGHFRMPAHRPLSPEIEVVIAPRLEAYVTPLGNDEALVALLGGRALMRRFAGDLAGGYERVVRGLPRLAESLCGAELLPGVRATGPFAARAQRVAGSGVLLLGDAAGFLDPITGEGMAAALLQARAASVVIDRALATGDEQPDLSAYAAEHRRLTATGNRLTWISLGICGSPWLARRAMAGLQSRPGLFGKLLAVNCGYTGLRSIAPREWLALVSGY